MTVIVMLFVINRASPYRTSSKVLILGRSEVVAQAVLERHK